MTTASHLIEALQREYAQLPQVEALALGGSRARDLVPADDGSDIDLYVFTRGDIPLQVRDGIFGRLGQASRAEIDQRFWGPSDQWIDAASGLQVDVIYFDAGWMQAAIERVLVHHQASMGYTTCFWHTIRQSLPLYDRQGWLSDLKRLAAVDYPRPLRDNIIALNHPVLRGSLSSYASQIDKAVRRGDLVSLNHRVSALLASYFDCVFAASAVPHPGEKRLLELAAASCSACPVDMAADVKRVLRAAAVEPGSLSLHLTALLDHLDDSLVRAGLVLPTSGVQEFQR
ncbi:MAG: hypothetical protein RIQ60_610 [Pseudomonadota bacterium]|jgi:hypothetical protein